MWYRKPVASGLYFLTAFFACLTAGLFAGLAFLFACTAFFIGLLAVTVFFAGATVFLSAFPLAILMVFEELAFLETFFTAVFDFLISGAVASCIFDFTASIALEAMSVI